MKAAFWSRFPELVWSNAEAGDSVRIRAALLAPRFETLLAIAVEFGLKRLRSEWAVLAEEDSPETRRATNEVERMLRHIGVGFADAPA